MAKKTNKIEKRKKKPLFCKLGFHKADSEHYYVRKNNTTVTSRSAFCKRCGKRLFLVDKYGEKRSETVQ